MRIQARLLLFDTRRFLSRPCGLGFAFPTVGELGAWGARDVIKDGGLNAFQERHGGRTCEVGEICLMVQRLCRRINADPSTVAQNVRRGSTVPTTFQRRLLHTS